MSVAEDTYLVKECVWGTFFTTCWTYFSPKKNSGCSEFEWICLYIDLEKDGIKLL